MVAALANSSVKYARILNDISLTDDDWKRLADSLVTRSASFTMSGDGASNMSTWPVLDLGASKGKVRGVVCACMLLRNEGSAAYVRE